MDPLTFDPAIVYSQLLEAGNSWSDAKAAADLLAETRKSVLAELKLASDEKSDAARETAALASGAYREHVSKMVEAERKSNRARVQYDALRTLAELRRSEYVTRRAEAQLL